MSCVVGYAIDTSELGKLQKSVRGKNAELQIALEQIELSSKRDEIKYSLKEIILHANCESNMVNGLFDECSAKLGLTHLALCSLNLPLYPAKSDFAFCETEADSVRAAVIGGVSNLLRREADVASIVLPEIEMEPDCGLAFLLRNGENEKIGYLVAGGITNEIDEAWKIAMLKDVAKIVALKILEIKSNKLISETNKRLILEVENRTSELVVLNENLEAFAYSVSHDLKTPLRHITSYIGLLKSSLKESLSEDVKTNMGFIISAASKMSDLISALLSFSRLGKQDMNRSVVQVRPIIERIMYEQMRLYPDNKIEFGCDVASDVYADKILISQVFENLISNAFKYSSKNEVIKIKVQESVTATENVFYITDNGAGFDNQFAGKLFHPFQRLHSQSDFEGTGIGLANAARIVKRHGGKICATGVKGCGAEFIVSIPRQ